MHKTGEQDIYSKWEKSLSEEEIMAIKNYSGDDYRVINNYLRGITGSIDDMRGLTITHLKNALGKASVPHQVKVYRGTDIVPIDHMIKLNKYGEVDVDSMIGKTFTDNGFTSTSVLKESSFNNDITWIIDVPEGTNAAYIGQISHFPNETELLLDAG